MRNWALIGLAGTIVVIITMIGHPLWLSTLTYYDLLVWVYWSLGIGFIIIAVILSLAKRYLFLQYLFGLWGFAWFIIWFSQCFPNFSISLI